MINWQKIIVKPESSLKDVIAVIDKSALQFAVVLNEKKQLLGSVTDGDVRRAIIKGLDLNTSISKIMNSNPIFAYESSSKIKQVNIMRKFSIKHLPILNIEDEVVGILSYSELTDIDQKQNVVVVMAGGLGLRLRPLTDDLPKPMLLLDDKPILEHIIINFIKQGFNNFIISVNYKANIIKDYFKNGDKWDIKISYVQEDSKLGTAGALALLDCSMNKPLIVTNGDVLTNLDFTDLLKFHSNKKSDATMVLKSLQFKFPFGIPELVQDRIIAINEKPLKKFLINAGIYVFSPKIIKLLPKEKIDMTEFFEKLIKNKKNIFSYKMSNDWIDIGEKRDYYKLKDKLSDFIND